MYYLYYINEYVLIHKDVQTLEKKILEKLLKMKVVLKKAEEKKVQMKVATAKEKANLREHRKREKESCLRLFHANDNKEDSCI